MSKEDLKDEEVAIVDAHFQLSPKEIHAERKSLRALLAKLATETAAEGKQ